jgi:hypothetical protein
MGYKRILGYRCLIALTALATPVLAQQANIQSVSLYHVKRDRVADFQAAIKEYNAVIKKAGADHYYSVWLSVTGPGEYVRVDIYNKWSDLDTNLEPKLKEHEADVRSIGTRITQCTDSSSRIVREALPELSLPSSEQAPKMIRVLQTRVRPDKVNEYLALWKSEVLPAAKKSGLTVFSLAQVRYGGPSTEFVSLAGLNSWADLDGGFGVEKAMGKEGYQSFLTRIRPLIIESEYNLYRFQPDLSYLPAPAGK